MVNMLNQLALNKITDENVKELQACHILYFSGCNKITNKRVKELRDCHTLDISYCNKITNKLIFKKYI